MRAWFFVALVACGGTGPLPTGGSGGTDPVGSNTDRPPSSTDPVPGGGGGACACPVGTYQCDTNFALEVTSTDGQCTALDGTLVLDPCGGTYTAQNGPPGTLVVAGGVLTFCATQNNQNTCTTCTQ